MHVVYSSCESASNDEYTNSLNVLQWILMPLPKNSLYLPDGISTNHTLSQTNRSGCKRYASICPAVLVELKLIKYHDFSSSAKSTELPVACII